MWVYRRILTTLLALSLLILLAGCSAVKFGYVNGATILYWWADAYVEFQVEQKPWARNYFADLMAWHRATQLKEYAQLLTQVRQRIQQGGRITAAEILDTDTAIRKHARTAVDHALPGMADLALMLQPEQIEHIERKFASNNDTYRKDYLSGDLESRQRLRFKKIMKQAEYWFGDFTPDQEARIRAASDVQPLNDEIWMAEWLQRQQAMLVMLKKIQAEKPSREVVQALLKNYVNTGFQNFTYEQNKAFFDATREGLAQLIAVIVNVATPEQRAHAIRRIDGLVADCNALAE